MAKAIFKIYKPVEKETVCDTVRVTAEAYKAIIRIQTALNLPIREIASTLILAAAEDYEVVEVGS